MVKFNFLNYTHDEVKLSEFKLFIQLLLFKILEQQMKTFGLITRMPSANHFRLKFNFSSFKHLINNPI